MRRCVERGRGVPTRKGMGGGGKQSPSGERLALVQCILGCLVNNLCSWGPSSATLVLHFRIAWKENLINTINCLSGFALLFPQQS